MVRGPRKRTWSMHMQWLPTCSGGQVGLRQKGQCARRSTAERLWHTGMAVDLTRCIFAAEWGNRVVRDGFWNGGKRHTDGRVGSSGMWSSRAEHQRI